ncbi:hypothetical protein Tsubulata_006409, partial [Turnera subulata]
SISRPPRPAPVHPGLLESAVAETMSTETSVASDKSSNMFTNILDEVSPDLLYFSVLEDEVAEMQNFLVEPEYNRDYLDGAAGLEPFNRLMDFDFESFSGSFKHDEGELYNDGPGQLRTEGGGEAKLEEDSNRLQGNNETILHENFVVQPTSIDTSLHSHEKDSGEADRSDRSSEITMVHESKFDKNLLLRSQLTNQELQEVSKISAQKQCLNHLDLQYQGTMDSKSIVGQKAVEGDQFDDSNALKFSASSSLVTKIRFRLTDKTNAAVAFPAEKKRPKSARSRRCTAGPYVQKPMHEYRLSGMCYKSSSRGFLTVGSSKQRYRKRSGAAELFYGAESSEGSCTTLSFGHRIQKEQSENELSLDNNSEDGKENSGSASSEVLDKEHSSAIDDVSKDECFTSSDAPKGGNRTGRCRWTLFETKKLIEGVSQCGVGKWKCIKKLMFSSSRLTAMQLKNGRGVKQVSDQLPESVLCRVRDLAATHSRP